MLKTGKRFWMMVAVLAFSMTAYAFPPSAVNTNNNCAACHSNASDRAEVIGNDGMLSVDGVGPLKVFNVEPGSTASLQVQVTDGSSDFALQIKDFEKDGLVDASTLIFAPDAAWFEQVVANPPYYTIPQFGGIDWQSPITRTFNLAVDAATPLDVYKLVFAVAGDGGGDGLWNDTEEFLVNVIPEPASAIMLIGGAVLLVTRRISRS